MLFYPTTKQERDSTVYGVLKYFFMLGWQMTTITVVGTKEKYNGRRYHESERFV